MTSTFAIHFAGKKWDWQSFVAELARITGGVRLEDGWSWWGWQTKTSGDPLGPRPDQFRPIHFDLLHLLDFCVFNDFDAKYFLLCSFLCKCTYCNWVRFYATIHLLSVWLCLRLNGFRGRKALPGHLGGTLRGQSDSDANIVIYYLIKQSTVEHCKHEMNKSTR